MVVAPSDATQLADPTLHPADTNGDIHRALRLPAAAPVSRPHARELPRRRTLNIALLFAGLLLSIGTVASGSFGDIAAGRQMLAEFSPHVDRAVLDGYRADLQTLGDAGAGLTTAYSAGAVTPSQFPALDDFRENVPDIVGRSSTLIDRIDSGATDFHTLAGSSALPLIPILLFGVGLLAVAGGAIGWLGKRRSARTALTLAAAGGLLLTAVPVASDLPAVGTAGDRMLATFSEVMTADQVRGMQDDFVVVVTAVGVLDTEFADTPLPDDAADPVARLIDNWPAISGSLAELVGTVNDNLANFSALSSLAALGRPAGVSAFVALPWVMGGSGLLIAVLSLAACPRRLAHTTENTQSQGATNAS